MPPGKGVSLWFGQMRVAVLAECYLPAMNGVTGSMSRLVRHLELRGHEALIVTPGEGPESHSRTAIARVPGRRLPWFDVVARAPNRTLSWLTGTPVERLTVVREVAER